MRTCLLLLALSACAPDLGAERPPVRGADTVRLATWNVHDLFDEVDRVVPPGDHDLLPAPAEVEARLDALAAVLLKVDADVVLLQEVENTAILGRLAARAGYPETRLVEGRDPRGIDVAALSRLAVDAYVSHLGDLDGLGKPLWPRDCVELHVRTAGRPVVAVVSHFSSALSDDGRRRVLQAERLRELADGVRQARPGARVVAGGDLNDTPRSAPLAALVGDGAWVDLTPPAAVTWSSGGAAARLDYLLVSRGEEVAVSGVEVVDGDDVRRASDHRPVVLDLRVR